MTCRCLCGEPSTTTHVCSLVKRETTTAGSVQMAFEADRCVHCSHCSHFTHGINACPWCDCDPFRGKKGPQQTREQMAVERDSLVEGLRKVLQSDQETMAAQVEEIKRLRAAISHVRDRCSVLTSCSGPEGDDFYELEQLIYNYEKDKAALKEFRATEATLGVGDGGGELFVHGSYEAIKRVQEMIFELGKLRSDAQPLKCGHTMASWVLLNPKSESGHGFCGLCEMKFLDDHLRERHHCDIGERYWLPEEPL